MDWEEEKEEEDVCRLLRVWKGKGFEMRRMKRGNGMKINLHQNILKRTALRR